MLSEIVSVMASEVVSEIDTLVAPIVVLTDIWAGAVDKRVVADMLAAVATVNNHILVVVSLVMIVAIASFVDLIYPDLVVKV
jgi:hypothetical protein